MKGKKHSPEQIIKKLRESEAMIALSNRTPSEFARNSAGHAPLNSLVR